jgi:hypothetical protein
MIALLFFINFKENRTSFEAFFPHFCPDSNSRCAIPKWDGHVNGKSLSFASFSLPFSSVLQFSSSFSSLFFFISLQCSESSFTCLLLGIATSTECFWLTVLEAQKHLFLYH